MEIKKGNIKLNKSRYAMASTLVEADVVVPDTCPDVAEILNGDAKIKITDTECRNGKLNVYGVAEFCALYVPEDKCSELKSVSEEIDFSVLMDIKAEECDDIDAWGYAEHIGFTLVNSRKISAKIMVGIKACANSENIYEPVLALEDADAECREKKHSIYIPLSHTKTDIQVSDILTVPEDMPDIAEILRVDAHIVPNSSKTLSGKEMIHAELHIDTIYTAADEKGSVVCVHHAVPFTEIAEAPGADEQSVVNVAFDVKNIFAASKGNLNGDTKIISVDATVCCDVKVTKSISENIIDDCYFLDCGTTLTKQKMKAYEYITSENARLTHSENVELPKNTIISEVISCFAKLKSAECTWENGAVKAVGTLVTNIIYRDENANVCSLVNESEVHWDKAMADECEAEVNMWIENADASALGDSVRYTANVGMFAKVLKPRDISIITDVCQMQEENRTKAPSFVVCFAGEGDTVWDIAKKYRVKAEKIKSANKLESEKIEKGRRLLIPKA